MRIAAVQHDIVWENREANFARLAPWLAGAAGAVADLVLLTETFSTGFSMTPGIGEPESLQIRSRELPDPATYQALVRVEATGVSFAEQQMRRGKYYDQPPFPFVPGYDLVGTVERLTQRNVVAFMSANHIDPDSAAEIFVLDGAAASSAG